MRRPMLFAFIGLAAGILSNHIFFNSKEILFYILLMSAATVYLTAFACLGSSNADAEPCPEADAEQCQQTGAESCPKAIAESCQNSGSVSFFLYLRRQSVLLRRICLFLLLISVGGAYYGSYSNISFPYTDKIGETLEVSGVVTSVSIKSEDYAYLELDIKGPGKLMAAVSGNCDELTSLCGCLVSFRGELTTPDPATNPKCFDYQLYLKTRGIYVIQKGKASDLKIKSQPSGMKNKVIHAAASYKYSFMEHLEGNMDETSKGLLIGMLFGDKTYMDPDIFSDFQKNGISHILAVSGIHVGIIYAFLDRLLRKPKKFLSNLPIMIGLVFYAALANFSSSVVRAVFMICVYIMGKLFYFRYDILSCTSFCGIIIILKNPAILFNTGFQLSFLAVFTVGLVMPRALSLGDSLKKIMGHKHVIDALVPMISIQVGMFPATAYLFYYFSWGAFLLNIPVIAVSGIIIPLGILLTVLSPFAPELMFRFIATITEILIHLMKLMNDIVTDSGMGFTYIKSPTAGMLLFYYLILFFICSEAGQRIISEWRSKKTPAQFGRRSIAVIMLAAILCSCFTMYVDRTYRKADVVMLDVGQGDAVHIKAEKGIDVLFDSGGSHDYDVGEKILLPYFLRNRVGNIDAAIITHLHEDHYGGLKSLAHLMEVKKLFVYEANRLREDIIVSECGITADKICYVAAGDKIKLSENVNVEILFPGRKSEEEYKRLIEDEEDENKLSLIARIHFGNQSILITGDMTSDDEEELIEKNEKEKAGGGENLLCSDILKVAHHGSRYSSTSDFLNQVNPKLAVIQVGQNFYGHPSAETISRIRDSGADVMRTDIDGAVMIDIRKNDFRVLKR